MKTLLRENREIKPFVVKLGFALTLSCAGRFVSHLSTRRRSRRHSGKQYETVGKGLKDELLILKREDALAKVINGKSTTITTTTTTTTYAGLWPKRKSYCDEDRFLDPEFNDLLLRDFDGSPTGQTLRKADTRGERAMEHDIRQIKHLVISLREREKTLELQLLEYYGLQEQEGIMRELESQVKINTMESKLFSLKIESLQSENQRLRAQLLDYSKTMNDLDAARAKVKSLKRKLRTVEEEAGEKMAPLQQEISVLQSKVEMDERNRADLEKKLKMMEDMEHGVLNLRMLNSELSQQNFELREKLEDSLLAGPEVAFFSC